MSKSRLIYLVLALVGAALMTFVLTTRCDKRAIESAQPQSPEPAAADVSAPIVEPSLASYDDFYQAGMTELNAAEANVEILRLLPAEDAIQQALNIDSMNVDGLEAMGRIRALQDRFEDAIGYFDRVLWIDPMRAAAWGRTGDAWMELGQYRYADSCYSKMMAIDSGFHSLLRAARGTFELHSFDRAVELCDRAIAIGPQTNIQGAELASGHVTLGTILTAGGFWEEARRNVDAARELAPDAIGVLALHGELCVLEGDLAAAKAAYRDVIRRSPHPTFKSDLARVYERDGDQAVADSLVAIAIRDFDRLGRTFPTRIQREQAEFLLDWGLELERATKMVYRVSRKRHDFYTYEVLARAYLAGGQYELAWSSIALVLRRDPQHPRLFHTAAVIAKAAGKPDQFATYALRARQANGRTEEQYGSW